MTRLPAVALLLLLPLTARAADQTILGKQVTAKNPNTPDKRKVVVNAKEVGSPNTIVGDPVANGGTLTITLDGGTPVSSTFALPTGSSPTTGQPFWSGSAASGYKYKDAKADNGPVKGVALKVKNGVFKLNAVAVGKLAPLAIVPPNPGTSACLLLDIAGGDSYSVAFVDGAMTNKTSVLFKVKNPTVQQTCVATTTTTLPPDTDGDGVPDALDNCPTVSNPSQVDTDADAHGDDCDPCPSIANPGPAPCPTTTTTTLMPDTDGDGVPDALDNCPTVSNPSQVDTDADAHGDDCDACPLDANPGLTPCP